MIPNPSFLSRLSVPILAACFASSLNAASVTDLTFDDLGTTISVRSCVKTATGTLDIPATVNNKPVTAIGLAAFSQCDKLTIVTIPAGVTDIGKQAFFECKGLTQMKLPTGLRTIDEEAFVSCSAMATLTFPSTLRSIGKGAFYNCAELQSLIFPTSLLSIEDYAFLTCPKLKKATFSGKAPIMGDLVFNEAAPGFTIFCYKGYTGYTSPRWFGYPLIRLGSEIAVEQPAGSNLADGKAKRSFGTVKVRAQSKSKVFIIKNKGTASLTGVTVKVLGVNTNDFIVTRPLVSSVTAGSYTTFKVVFKPRAIGTRKAIIRVTSNDANENPFDIQVTGAGAPK